MKEPEILNKFPEMFNRLELHHRNKPPLVCFREEEVKYFSEISSLRMKSWQSSKRVNPKADATGLLGEIGFFRWLGYSGKEVIEDFISGINGDNGVDVYFEDMAIDVKTTASKDNKLKFLFTKSNKNSNTANVIAFVRLIELMDGSMNAWLIGWSWKNDVNHFLRDSEKYPHIQTLYLDSLKWNKVLYPLSHLTLHQGKEVNSL